MQKRALFFTAIVVIVFAISPVQARYSGGTGEPNNPYLIGTPNDLNSIGLDPCDWDKHFLLVNDINMAGFEYTAALIAPDNDTADYFQGTYFTGVFDGNSHSISNFTCQSADSDYIGLFGYINNVNSKIKNLTLINPDVYGREAVGSLAGILRYGTITNCNAEGAYVSGNGSVGGLLGINADTISNCYATGAVDGNSTTGRLVGHTFVDSKTLNCYATVTVDGNNSIGGLAGTVIGGSYVSNCYATGNVSGNRLTGGLAGHVAYYNYEALLRNCYATGGVSGNYVTGGFA